MDSTHATHRQWRQRVFLGLLCGMLLFPTIALPLQSGDASGAENRALSDAPAWSRTFGLELEAWYREHFAFRTTFVNAYNQLTRCLFATSATPAVTLGKDDWLFFSETMPDVTGQSALSEADCQHLVRVFALMDAYVTAQQGQFMVTVAPNKASIYPEQLPWRYRLVHAQNALDQLTAALANSSISYCDLRESLRVQAATSEQTLYHALDTHWNNCGAMVAYTALMADMQQADGNLAATPYTMEQNWTGDLWTMLAPTQSRMDWNATYALTQTYQYRGRFRGLDDLTIQTQCADRNGSLWMVRDSFGRALIPLLAEGFAECTFLRANRVPLDALASKPADWVVFEIAERNLETVLQTAPQMPAPQVEILSPNAVAAGADPLSLVAKAEGAYWHLYGQYDAEYAACSAVYCTVTDDPSDPSTATSYEAFPCCEQSALGLSQPAANGFSLFLPKDALPSTATVALSVQTANGICCVGQVQWSDEQFQLDE